MSFKFTKSNLNFDVYTSASKPTTPGANNDIAIITSVPMPNWIMSPDKPSGTPRSDGDVWIQYSVSGNTFNALKNSTMMIATISAWQYVDGEWANVEAVSYQDGSWTQWIKFLLGDGVNSLGIPTWKTIAGTASGDTLVTSTSENNDGTVSLSVKTASGKWTNILGIFPVEVKPKHGKLSISLVCTGKSSSESSDTFAVRLYSDYEAANRIATSTIFTGADVQLNKIYSVDFDITSIEKFYIAVYVCMGNTSVNPMDVTITEIKME